MQQVFEMIWEFPKLVVPYFGGGHNNEDYSIMRSILGSPSFGKLPNLGSRAFWFHFRYNLVLASFFLGLVEAILVPMASKPGTNSLALPGPLTLSCCLGFRAKDQVPNNHIFAQNPYYNYYYPKPKCLILGYMDPLG